MPTFSPADLARPLKKADLDDLDAFADQYDLAFAVTGLQGFFAALATAPSLIQPSTWLGFLAEEPEFESEEEMNQVLGLLFRLYNQVGSQIRERSTAFLPDVQNAVEAEEWCVGYMRGVELDDIWDDEDDDGVQDALLSIASIADDVTEESLGEILGDEDIGEWLEKQRENLPDTVRFLYDYWAEARRPPGSVTKKRVGRNDPCPCGSGKKYKKCCGRA